MLTFEELNEIKFEAALIHLLSDVFVAVADCSLPGTWTNITSLRLRSLIGQLSFFLIPNIVLGKMKIHEHRTEQTYEGYMFQPLMSC